MQGVTLHVAAEVTDREGDGVMLSVVSVGALLGDCDDDCSEDAAVGLGDVDGSADDAVALAVGVAGKLADGTGVRLKEYVGVAERDTCGAPQVYVTKAVLKSGTYGWLQLSEASHATAQLPRVTHKWLMLSVVRLLPFVVMVRLMQPAEYE